MLIDKNGVIRCIIPITRVQVVFGHCSAANYFLWHGFGKNIVTADPKIPSEKGLSPYILLFRGDSFSR